MGRPGQVPHVPVVPSDVLALCRRQRRPAAMLADSAAGGRVGVARFGNERCGSSRRRFAGAGSRRHPISAKAISIVTPVARPRGHRVEIDGHSEHRPVRAHEGTAPLVDVPRCRTDRRQQNASRVLSYDAMRFFDEGRRTALRWRTKAVINGAHAERARQARLSWTCWAYLLDSQPTSGVSVSLRASPPRRRAAPITGANLRSIPPRYSARAPRRNRALQTFQKPHFAHRADHGKPKMSPQAELERYCELIAALKLRTTNKAGRRRSTGRAKHGRFRTRAVTPGAP